MGEMRKESTTPLSEEEIKEKNKDDQNVVKQNVSSLNDIEEDLWPIIDSNFSNIGEFMAEIEGSSLVENVEEGSSAHGGILDIDDDSFSGSEDDFVEPGEKSVVHGE